jgi:ABC-type proline/glycine betaine transport system ATPase subunit
VREFERSTAWHTDHIFLRPFGAFDPATRLSMQDLIVGLRRELQATVPW